MAFENMAFESIWANIVGCAGQEFETVTRLPFTYRIVGNAVVTSRTGQRLTRRMFERAAQIENLSGPGQISGSIRGSSYIYAILSDRRIR